MCSRGFSRPTLDASHSATCVHSHLEFQTRYPDKVLQPVCIICTASPTLCCCSQALLFSVYLPRSFVCFLSESLSSRRWRDKLTRTPLFFSSKVLHPRPKSRREGRRPSSFRPSYTQTAPPQPESSLVTFTTEGTFIARADTTHLMLTANRSRSPSPEAARPSTRPGGLYSLAEQSEGELIASNG